MKKNKINNLEIKEEVVITEKGSLGLLALGDIGLRKWREVRNKTSKINYEEE